MKLIYIHQHFSTLGGSTGTRSYDFSRYLAQRGHEVTVICGIYDQSSLAGPARRRLIERQKVDGIDVVSINIRYSNYMSFATRMGAFFAFMFLATLVGLREKADLVFATSTPIFVGVPGAVIGWLRRIPFVFEVRDLWPESVVAMGMLTNPRAIRAAEWLERFLYRRAVRVVCISRGIRDILTRRGLPEEKVVLIRFGADVQLFGGQESEDACDGEFTSRYGLDGKFIALFAGAHGSANGLEVVLAAAERLQAAGEEDIAVVLMGEGGRKPGLKQQAQELGLANVTFADPVPRSRMPAVLACAGAVLMILRNLKVFETACPNKFFDYLASGRPIVVNFPGELRELLEEHGCGLFAEPDSPEALAAALLKLKGDPGLARRMGEAARKLAVSLDRLEMARQFEAMLMSVLAERARGLAVAR
jgi:glycosyltransferase involved in cell wall biosynthesis